MTSARLFVLGGRDAGRAFDIDAERGAVIGRDPECDVRLSDRSISRRHARLVRVGDAWELADLGSRNGVVRASQRVERTVLADRDEVSLGEVPVRFRVGGKERAASPALPAAAPPESPESDEVEVEFDAEEIELEEPDEIELEAAPAVQDAAARASAAPVSKDGAVSAAERARAARRAEVLASSRAGWLRGDLAQQPFWVRASAMLFLLTLFGLVLFAAFRGVQSLRATL